MRLPRPSRFEVYFYLVLLICVGIVFYFSYQLKDVQNAISIIEGKGPIVIKGNDGLTPPCYFTTAQCQGSNGVDGTNGKNATSTNTVIEHDTATTTVVQEQIQGPPGANGQDGREVGFCYMSDGTLGEEYTGDRNCTAIPNANSVSVGTDD